MKAHTLERHRAICLNKQKARHQSGDTRTQWSLAATRPEQRPPANRHPRKGHKRSSKSSVPPFFIALALARTGPNGKIEVTGDLSLTQLKFRHLSTEQIAFYVAQDMPTDAAGAFKAEGLGISLFDYVRADDPSALIGLPLITLTTRLREFGIDPLSGSRDS